MSLSSVCPCNRPDIYTSRWKTSNVEFVFLSWWLQRSCWWKRTLKIPVISLSFVNQIKHIVWRVSLLQLAAFYCHSWSIRHLICAWWEQKRIRMDHSDESMLVMQGSDPLSNHPEHECMDKSFLFLSAKQEKSLVLLCNLLFSHLFLRMVVRFFSLLQFPRGGIFFSFFLIGLFSKKKISLIVARFGCHNSFWYVESFSHSAISHRFWRKKTVYISDQSAVGF